MTKELIDMEIGEFHKLGNGRTLIRVPGGWVHESYCSISGSMSTCFIPEQPEPIKLEGCVDWEIPKVPE